MTDSTLVTNRALAQIGSRSQITSMTDGSAEALYANLLYVPLRDFLLREGDYDFSMVSANPVLAGVEPAPWSFSYQYPINAIRIRSLVPLVYDEFNPLPVEYNVVSVVTTKFILTKVNISLILITYPPLEDVWDSMFMEAFTRLLASSLAFALQNRIEASKEKLTEALNFAGIANLRDS